LILLIATAIVIIGSRLGFPWRNSVMFATVGGNSSSSSTTVITTRIGPQLSLAGRTGPHSGIVGVFALSGRRCCIGDDVVVVVGLFSLALRSRLRRGGRGSPC